MNGYTRKVAFDQKLVEFDASYDVLYEDDHLVELEHIKDIVQFPVLLVLFERHVELLQTVES